MISANENQFTRHRGPITCVAGIPGSARAVVSGYDGAVSLCDLSERKVELLGYHKHLVNRITVDGAGAMAASSSSDYTVVLWDLDKREVAQVLRGHSDDVEDFVFIDDGVGCSVSRDRRVIVWDLNTGSILNVLEGHQKDVLSVDYHDGNLFTSGDDMTLRMWDARTGEVKKIWGPFDTETDTCAIDRVHGRVVLGCDDGVIRVFDIASGDTVAELDAHGSGIKKVATSSITGDILSAAYDQKILLWDAESLEVSVELQKMPSIWERSFNWSPDGSQILAGTFDGTVLNWDVETGEFLCEITGADEPAGNACFNDVASYGDDGIALVSDDGYLRLAGLSPEASEWRLQRESASGRILMNAVAADDRFGLIVGGSHNQKLHIYDQALDNETAVDLGEGPINCVRISQHEGSAGDMFVACYSGAIVRVSSSGEIKGKFHPHENAVKALRLHPHKPLGISCSADGILASWDFGGDVLNFYPGHTAIIDDVDIDPSGKYVASVGRDFILKVHDIAGGQLTHVVPLSYRSPKGVCFWDENTVVISNYWGELIKVTLADNNVFEQEIALNGISAVTRRGDHLVAASYDGGAYLVCPDSLQEVQVIRAMTQKVAPAVY